MGGPGAAAGVFDGIDVDWEWPGSEGNAGNIIRPEDKKNYVKLLEEFRKQLRAYGKQTDRELLLTAFLPASAAKIDAGVNVPDAVRRAELRNGPGVRPPRRMGADHEPPVEPLHLAERSCEPELLG